jgi:hypothetical protein
MKKLDRRESAAAAQDGGQRLSVQAGSNTAL